MYKLIPIAAIIFLLTGCVVLPSSESISFDNKKITIQKAESKAQLTVKNLTLHYYPEAKVLSDPSEQGNQFIKLELNIKNISQSDFPVAFGDFYLDTHAEKEKKETIWITNDHVSDKLPSGGLSLLPGEEIVFGLYYEVSGLEDATTVTLNFIGLNNNLVEEVFSLDLN